MGDINAKIKLGFNLGHLPKHKFKVFFIAISRTTRSILMKFGMQAGQTPAKRLKQKENMVQFMSSYKRQI